MNYQPVAKLSLLYSSFANFKINNPKQIKSKVITKYTGIVSSETGINYETIVLTKENNSSNFFTLFIKYRDGVRIYGFNFPNITQDSP